MTAVLTTPIKLSNNTITAAEANLGLVTLDANGLAISTGAGYYSDLSYLPPDQRNILQYLSAFDGSTPASTLTTALFKNVHLVEGQTISITFQYNSLEAGDPLARSVAHQAPQNDFAFAYLSSPTNAGSFNYLINTDLVNARHGTNVTTYGSSVKISQSGDYSLVIGNADVGDTSLNSTLTIKSITITTPDTGASAYTLTPTGMKFVDGSQLLANGSEVLPNGATIPGFLSAGGQQLLAYAIGRDAAIVSHDAGGIVSHDAGGLIGQDGGSLISQDGGGIVAENTSNLISQDGGGIVSHDAGGIVATGGGNFVPRISPYKSAETMQQTGPDLVVANPFLDKSSAAAGDVVNVSYQVKNGGTQSVASSTSAVYLSTDKTITNSDTALGALHDPSLAAGTAVSDTLDVRLPAGLAAGTYYLGVLADANGEATETDEGNNASTSLAITVGSSGTTPTPATFTPEKVGGEFSVAPDQSNFGSNAALGFANGNMGYVYFGSNGVTLQVLDPTGAPIASHSTPVSGFSLHAAKLADERVVVTFQDSSGDINGVIFNQDATISVPTFKIEHADGTTFLPEAVAALADGRFVVTELSFVPGQSNSQHYGLLHVLNPDGTTSVPTFTLQQPQTPGRYAEVTQLPDGRILVTDQAISPQDTAGSARNVYADFYSSSFASLGSTLISNNGYDLGNSNGKAAILSNGDFVSLFQTGRPPQSGNVRDYDGVHGRVFHSDGTLASAEFTVPGYSIFGQHNPVVTAIPTGGFVVSFEGTVTNDFNSAESLDIQRYNNDGTPNGDLIVIADGPTLPTPAILANGNLVEFYQNESSHEVGQVFALSGQVVAPVPPTTPAIGPDTTPAPGSAHTTPAGSDPIAGTHDLAFTDGYGHSVVDTLDAGDRLLKEVVKDAANGNILSTVTLIYKADSTYDQHSELATTTGSLTVDAVYGPKGELSETLRDETGQITSTATITYRDDGTVARQTTAAGEPGSDDFVYSSAFGAPNGGFVSHTHTDAAGHVTSIDVNGQAIVPTTSPENQPFFGTISHDVQDVSGKAFALYDGLLQRAPDLLGGENLAAALKAGASLHDLAQSILDAPETRVHLNAPDSAGFVEQLYETVLGRHGDTQGAAIWTGLLDHGASRADVALDFVFSNENLGQLAGTLAQGVFVADSTTSDVARLYHGILDRAPDAGGLGYWAGADQGGGGLKSIVQNFLASSEYAVSHPAQLGDVQFVESLYQAALGRSGDAAGAAGWTDALAHGASRADVAVGIVESAEAHQHLAPVIEAGWHLA